MKKGKPKNKKNKPRSMRFFSGLINADSRFYNSFFSNLPTYQKALINELRNIKEILSLKGV
ncbi:MAG: hypothetical protein PHE89_03020 [Alphaproteobacteria bacterium]|nr:hypothetical protein [Alphaproteobacteria bacterium]